MPEALKEQIIAYLKAHNTATLATSSGGAPWAASVFYVNDGFVLYFLSEPSSRHATSIEENQAVGAAINEDYHDWREIQGIQLEGQAMRVTGRIERAKVLALYVAKFPFVGKMLLSPHLFSGAVARAVAKVKFYKVVPTRLRFINNRKEFGYKEEIALPSAEQGKG